MQFHITVLRVASLFRIALVFLPPKADLHDFLINSTP